jgi:hypothetical protein
MHYSDPSSSGMDRDPDEQQAIVVAMTALRVLQNCGSAILCGLMRSMKSPIVIAV